MRLSARFERRIDALPALFAFVARATQPPAVHEDVRRTVDFVLEELFTNIVKYGAGQGPVEVCIESVPHGVEVVLDEPDARPFDPTQTPDADTTQPAAERRPGGLGLHLIRRMVDSIEYRYLEQERVGRVRFRKTHRPP